MSLRQMARAVALIVLAFVFTAPLRAQDLPTGRIVGRVVDAATGQGITDAGVQIVGTTLGVQSGVDGRFTFPRVNAGTVTIQVRRIGFVPKTVTGILLSAGQTLEQNVTLSQAAARVEAQVVTASSERGSVNDALDKQRTAVGVVNSVTAEQISRSPDSDASQAVQRVSGVTVQDDKTVAVRGLAERYTTVALNGARVPSPEPEKRIVPLDLFPAGLLQSVTTSKTFTPDQSGDFAGALVNIQTREFPAQRSITAQFTGGYATNSSGVRSIAAVGVGGETFGMAGSARNLPSDIKSFGNFQTANLTHAQENGLINQFRNAWTPTTKTAAPNSSAAVSVGGNDDVFGRRIGYLFSGSYSYATDLKDGQIRAQADRGTTPGSTVTIDQFLGQTAGQSILWGGLTNLSTMFGESSRLTFNGMYNRTADNDARVERGHFENLGVDAKITRMDYVERAVMSAQLGGEHQFNAHHLDWALTHSGVRRDEPDRSELVQVVTKDATGVEHLQWMNTGNEGAVRTFSNLDESSNEAKTNYQLGFNAFGKDHTLKLGGLFRYTDRSADTRAYSISAINVGPEVTSLEPEAIFDGRFSQPNDSVFILAPLGQGGLYKAKDMIGAGYAMMELGLSSKARLIGGARVEADNIKLDAQSTLGAPVLVRKTWVDVLPSLALNYQLNDAQQVRLSGSMTLARPEYRELAPVVTRDVLNGDAVAGNDKLARTRILNADARWEWYPSSGEIVSVGVFAKEFADPIERVYQATSGQRIVFYTNAKSATNYGVELEARKNLSFLTPALDHFQAFTNLTLMQSNITLRADTRASATNKSRRMVGQAPYVVNGGLTYMTPGNGLSATVLYNRIGARITAAGDNPLPDVVDQSRDALDFSLRLPVSGAFSARIDAKNLLDSPFIVRQGTVTREEFRAGRTVQAGLVWRP